MCIIELREVVLKGLWVKLWSVLSFDGSRFDHLQGNWSTCEAFCTQYYYS